MFGKLRILFNLPTQHKGQRPTELPLEIQLDGRIQTIMLPISDYPAVPIIFPIFNPPGILCGVSPTEVFWNSRTFPVFPNLLDNKARLARLRAKIGRPFNLSLRYQTPIGPFTRMLAKIAHANAVAEFGIDGFDRLLPPIILGESKCTPHYVGCIDAMPAMASPEFADGTHRLFFSLATVEIKNKSGSIVSRTTYLGAAIRLFKDMGSPTYFVVIGTPSRDTLQSLEEGALPGGQLRSDDITLFRFPED